MLDTVAREEPEDAYYINCPHCRAQALVVGAPKETVPETLRDHGWLKDEDGIWICGEGDPCADKSKRTPGFIDEMYH